MVLVIFVVVLVAGAATVATWTLVGRAGAAPTRVSVDELARGDVPPVCVMSGRHAGSQVDVEGAAGGFSPVWFLLLLAGPVGIIIIVVLMGRGSRFGGRLPVTDTVLETYNRRVRAARVAFGAAVAGAVLGLVALVAGDSIYTAPLAFVAAVAITGGVVSVVVAGAVARHGWPQLELEASRRWVMIRNAHPEFERRLDAWRRSSAQSHSGTPPT